MNAAYQTFVESIPFYGFAVMCVDHPQVQALAARTLDRRTITYGFSPQADVCAANVRATKDGGSFDVIARKRGDGPGVTLHDLFLPMAGRHNIQNAVAAVAVALLVLELRLDWVVELQLLHKKVALEMALLTILLVVVEPPIQAVLVVAVDI
jgi:UDP-N-acetylmuramate-alanine ligase